MTSTMAIQSSACENGDLMGACTFCAFEFESSEPTLRVDVSLFGDGNHEKSQWQWHSNPSNPMVLSPGAVVLIESPSDDSDNASRTISRRQSLPDDSTLECILPKTLQDHLIQLYFENIHPLCPVIDEFSFCKSYFDDSTELFQSKVPTIILRAMMLTALTHLDEERVPETGFMFLHEAQEALFELTNEMYAQMRFLTPTYALHIVLAKAAILLSYCSSEADYETNSELNRNWVELATYHMKAALWHSDSHYRTIQDRLEILYWCCIMRATVLAYARRQPNQLYLYAEREFAFELEMLLPSFGRERECPRYCDVATKSKMIDSFILFCELGRTLNQAILTQNEVVFPEACMNEVYGAIGGMNEDINAPVGGLNVQSLNLMLLNDFTSQICELGG